jgi:hypothetical protein
MDEPLVTRHSRGRALGSLLAAMVAAVLLTPQALVWPLRYLATFVHELGHLVAGILTGGTPVGFRVMMDGSGLAWTGGWPVAVSAGGYLGVALFGGALLYLNAFQGIRRVLLVMVGSGCLALGLAYGNTAWTLTLAVSLGGSLLAAGLWVPFRLQYHLVNYLGFYVGLQALGDLVSVLSAEASVSAFLVPFFGGPRHNDASILASHTGVPGIFWAALWGGLALAFLLWCAHQAVQSEVAEVGGGY